MSRGGRSNLRALWREAQFIAGSTSAAGWPKSRAVEVALAGRSNVGKSSLLNALVGRKALARVSSTPGRTREIVFFSVTPELTLVDLPGYGYAQRSKKEREEWGHHIEQYLEERENLALVVVLIDGRHGPTDLDLALLDYLEAHEVGVQIVFTKVDKLAPSRRRADIDRHLRALPGVSPEEIILVSSETGEGVEELRHRIHETGETAGGRERRMK